MNTRIVALGDAAWLVEWLDAGPPDALLGNVHAACHALATSPCRPIGVGEAFGACASLVVRYDPTLASPDAVREWCRQVLMELPAKHPPRHVETHEIPVCYASGEDLENVANHTGMMPEDVIRLHSGAEYHVAMIGFAPGFPYLSGLPAALHVPRLATPRDRVHAGSVAIAAGLAGIYPSQSPAGWHVLGRTDLQLFSPTRSGRESLLLPGDRVRFVPVEKLNPPGISDARPSYRPDVEVMDPGFFTTIQDLGRPGHEHIGVSPGGAMDVEALKVANLLLGNAAPAAALGITGKGPVLHFALDARVVLVGADSTTGLRHGRAIDARAGSQLDVGTLTSGTRAILAVAGGIEVTHLLGSRSTDVRGRFGGLAGRKLRAGDRLPLGRPPSFTPPAIDGTRLAAPPGKSLTLRVIPGPQESWFGRSAVDAFYRDGFTITSRQDRMGIRLDGCRIETKENHDMVSQPVCTGSIQIPPDGMPVVLMAERQTHGGYPQIACVIDADVSMLARALPGTRVCFHPVALDAAHAARAKAEMDARILKAACLCPR